MEQTNNLCGSTFFAPSTGTKKREFRKLEDLNVIDNFLFQELLAQEGDGEEIDVDKHGIRLDAYIEEVVDELNGEMADAQIIPTVYDIEPNNTYERKTQAPQCSYYLYLTL